MVQFIEAMWPFNYSRFNEMESILTTLCHTVATLQGQMKKEDRPKSSGKQPIEKLLILSSRVIDTSTIGWC